MKEIIKKQYITVALSVTCFENGDVLTYSPNDGFVNGWDDLQNEFDD